MRFFLLAVISGSLLAGAPRLIFEQAPNSARTFVARGTGGSFGFTDREIVISTGKHRENLRIAFPGANPTAHAEGRDPLPGKSNYFIGPPAQWRTDIPQYGGVEYRSLYPGIDLVFHSNQGDMEYDFVLAAGADPSKIELQLDGARGLELTPAGDLLIDMPRGKVLQHAPVVYQMRGAKQVLVPTHYELAGRNRVRFRIGEYDASESLVIDPVLVFQSYVGGERTDVPAGIGVDRFGNSYVAGTTNSLAFPRVSQLANPIGGTVLLASFDYGATYTRPDIGAPVFALAGSTTQPDTVYAATSNGVYRSLNDGRTWVAANAGLEGVTINAVATDPQFPSRVYAGTYNGVYRSDDSGQTWQYLDNPYSANDASFLIGDGGNPQALYKITFGVLYKSTDGANTWTQITGLPSDSHVFSLAIDPNDRRVLYAAVYPYGQVAKSTDGGVTWAVSVDLDWLSSNQAIAVDPANSSRVFVIATDGIHRSLDGGKSWSAAGLETLTLDALAFDPAHPGVLYVVADEGLQVSQDHGATFHPVSQSPKRDLRTIFFTTSQVPAMLVGGDPDQDAFVVKWNPAGDHILYSTYIGGSYFDYANGITVDADGNTYLVGTTQSTDFPVTVGAFQTRQRGDKNGFLTKLSPDGNRLLYSTLLGGTGETQVKAVAIDSSGNAYVTGFTDSPDFSVTAGSMQSPTPAGCSTPYFASFFPRGHAFATKVSSDGARLEYSTYLGGSCSDAGYGIAVDTSGNALVVGTTYSTDFPTTPTSLQPPFGFAPKDQIHPAAGFLVKINGTGTSALYSSYVGSGNSDIASAVSVDAAGYVYVAGSSPGFLSQDTALAQCYGLYAIPATNPLQPQVTNVFMMKVDLRESSPLAFRLFDGCGQLPTAIVIDQRGNTWLSGGSDPSLGVPALTVSNPFAPPIDKTKRYGIPLVAPLAADGRGFVIEIAPDGITVPFSTYVPGKAFLSLDLQGSVHIATSETNAVFNKQNAFDPSTSLIKIDSLASYPILIQPPEPIDSLDDDSGDLSVGAGEVVAIAGQGIGPAGAVVASPDASGILSKKLSGVTVTFDEIAAPLISVQANRVVCVVPFGVINSGVDSVHVQVRYNELASNVIRLTSHGVPRKAVHAVLNQDGSVNSQANPARPGSTITLYASSLGQTVPPSVDGAINAGKAPLASKAEVYIAPVSPYRQAVVLFAGAAPGQVAGVAQINFVVPSDVSAAQEGELIIDQSGVAFRLWVASAPR
jgi:uncharacterized protein (TIGR03437 family)